MILKKKLLIALTVSSLVFTFAVLSVKANDKEYDAVVRHLKAKYQAKKVKIPFMWLARAAVSVAHPAGVKSFNLTVFENLNFSRTTLDKEMQSALRESFSADWTPIFRVRSQKGSQAYMYMLETGSDVKLIIVSIDNKNATVIRARFSADKLASFIDNPRIFGVSLNDGDDSKEKKNSTRDGDNKTEKTSKNIEDNN